ncbi:MAG: aspartyl/asparaginyl beta-hydroxylase domain-containing protein [Parasphingopyxis sp.]|uniref:aspartyl/asparaginyl beta-hydroxylase domain-containing protein n=1 Tax=Parasphingopyxis sp. TaxID=1920299 RepID=UPI003F9F179D
MAETFEPPRPWVINIGKKLRPAVDRAVAKHSDVSNDPVLDPADFPHTRLLEDNWETIRDEALAISARPDSVPALDEISPDHQGIAPAGMWRSFFLYGYGYPAEENIARCPKTAEIVRRIPGLNSAFFSILKPGTHIPDHRGVTKGLITCHLGLSVPKEGDCRMRVDDQIVRWEEGKTLVFDDTYRHEVWNDSDETRVVLLVQTKRPTRFPGNMIGGLFLWAVKRTPFVKEARANIAKWDETLSELEAARNAD